MSTITTNHVASKLLTKDDVHAKLAKKFGHQKIESLTAPVSAPSDDVKLEVSGKTKEVKSFATPANMVNIGGNDPSSSETQDKLKYLLQTGAFQFNEKEREALQQILK
jgi:hypothetical protein